MKFKKIDNNYFGFADLTISEVYSMCKEFFTSLDMLITSIDSDREPGKSEFLIDKFLKKGEHFYKIIGRGIWLPFQDFDDLFSRDGVFIHFDEVYLFEPKTQIITIPEKTYTTDGTNFSGDIPSHFIDNFKILHAKRFLSDGSGMNFVCESLELVEKLQEIEKRTRLIRGHNTS